MNALKAGIMKKTNISAKKMESVKKFFQKNLLVRMCAIILLIGMTVPTKAAPATQVASVINGNLKQNIVYASPSSEAKKNIKKLVRQMDFFEISYIGSRTISKELKIKLTDGQMAKAAALSLSVKNLTPLDKGYFGDYVTFKLTNSKLRKASKDLFGKSLSTSKLRKVSNQSKLTVICDAYRKKDGTAVVYHADGETETDYAVKNITITQSKKGDYVVGKNIYCGYWGSNNGEPNYRIIYQVKRNKQSKYGYVIKSVRVKSLS